MTKTEFVATVRELAERERIPFGDAWSICARMFKIIPEVER